MFDPALIHSLQQTMSPPAIMPSAIERAWISPAAERGEPILEPWLTEAEERCRAWRTRLLDTESGLDAITSLEWSEEQTPAEYLRPVVLPAVRESRAEPADQRQACLAFMTAAHLADQCPAPVGAGLSRDVTAPEAKALEQAVTKPFCGG